MPLRYRLLFAAFFVALPGLVSAAPSSVTGIQAREENGQIHVSWQKLPDDQKIAYYRIFFASKSILQNKGAYDDFDIAQGSASEHILQSAPQGTDLYFSILAVNDLGEESPFFAEEASIQRIGSPSILESSTTGSTPMVDSATNQKPETSQPATATLSLLSAQAISSTGVTLNFSLPVVLTAEDAPLAFTIKDGSGLLLPVTKIVVMENIVTLHTLPQDSTKVYQVTVDRLQGETTDGQVALLDPQQNSVLFPAFQGGYIGSPQPQVPSAGNAMPTDIIGPQMRAQADGNGMFAVEVTWDITGDPTTISHFLVSQTVDHGRTFGSAMQLPGNARSIRIPNVPPVELGLFIQVVSLSGQTSRGSTGFIALAGGSQPSLPAQLLPPTMQSVTVPSVPKTSLPQSGIGLTVLIGIAGAAVGTAAMRRRARA